MPDLRSLEQLAAATKKRIQEIIEENLKKKKKKKGRRASGAEISAAFKKASRSKTGVDVLNEEDK